MPEWILTMDSAILIAFIAAVWRGHAKFNAMAAEIKLLRSELEHQKEMAARGFTEHERIDNAILGELKEFKQSTSDNFRRVYELLETRK